MKQTKNKKIWIHLWKAFSLILILSMPATLFGQSEEEMDQMFLDSSSGAASSTGAPEIYGYLESENVYAPLKGRFAKMEARDRTTFKFGSPFFYGLATADAFFYPQMYGETDQNITGVLRLYEGYVSVGEKLQFKLGQQVFNWGSADAFRIVNYLDRRDLSELFFKEEDERYAGTFAATLKLILGDFAIEGVFAPYHTPFIFAGSTDYWAIQTGAISGLTPTLDYSQLPAESPENYSGALRAGGTFGAVDMHISYFHGISNTIIFVPEITYTGVVPSAITLYPDYHVSDKIGIDAAFTIDKLAARVELLYSPNETAAVVNSYTQKSATLARQDTTSTQYLGYTAGLDYNLWGTNGSILVEYSNTHYISNDNLEDEFFSNFLIVRLKDKWFSEKLDIEASVVMRLNGADTGYAPSLSLTWEFPHGVKLSGGYLMFVGNNDSLFSSYDDHDIAYLRAKVNY